MKTPSKTLVDFFLKKQAFLIHAHHSPDPDSIGSVLALKLGLESLNKVVYCYCEDDIEKNLFPPDIGTIAHLGIREALTLPHEAYICIDTAVWKLATYQTPVPVFPKPLVVIDHHPDNSIHGHLNWNNPQASSASEMIYDLLLKLKVEITPQIATCLLFGLLGDTGVFQNTNTSPRVFRITGQLIKSGGDYQSCVREIAWSHPLTDLKAWPMLLNNLKVADNGQYVWTTASFEEWSKYETGFRLEIFASIIIRCIQGTKFGAILVEKESGITKGSIRSRLPAVDVAQIAHRLNGGGHMAAAGFKIDKPILGAEKAFLAVVKELENQGKL